MLPILRWTHFKKTKAYLKKYICIFFLTLPYTQLTYSETDSFEENKIFISASFFVLETLNKIFW